MKKPKKAKYIFELQKASNGELYYHVKHRNGKTIWATETYKREGTAHRSILNFIMAVQAGDYEVK